MSRSYTRDQYAEKIGTGRDHYHREMLRREAERNAQAALCEEFDYVAIFAED
jgi:hypothetical protein